MGVSLDQTRQEGGAREIDDAGAAPRFDLLRRADGGDRVADHPDHPANAHPLAVEDAVGA